MIARLSRRRNHRVAVGDRRLRPLSRDVRVRDVMHPVPPVSTEMSIADVATALMDNPTGIVAVLEHESGRAVGVITITDLIEDAEIPLRPQILRYLREHGHPWSDLDSVPNARTAGAVMTTPFGYITAEQPAWEAAEQMAVSGFKALPVLDEDGGYAGMISRLDILRTISDIPVDPDATQAHPVRIVHEVRVAEFMRTDIPMVGPDTQIPAVLDAILSTPTHRALVTDADRCVLGIIGDADLMHLMVSKAPQGLLRLLRGAYLTDREMQILSCQTARAIMHPEVVTIDPDASLAAALTSMLDLHMRLLPVVNRQKRFVGYVARDQLLAGLIVPGTERDDPVVSA